MLHDNCHPGLCIEQVELPAAAAAQLLSDPARIDCPLPALLGLPISLIPTQQGRELVPVTVGGDPRR